MPSSSPSTPSQNGSKTSNSDFAFSFRCGELNPFTQVNDHTAQINTDCIPACTLEDRIHSLPDELKLEIVGSAVSVDYSVDVGSYKCNPPDQVAWEDWAPEPNETGYSIKRIPGRWHCQELASELFKPFRGSPKLLQLAREEFTKVNTFCIVQHDLSHDRLRLPGILLPPYKNEDEWKTFNQGQDKFSPLPPLAAESELYLHILNRPLLEVTQFIRHLELNINIEIAGGDLSIDETFEIDPVVLNQLDCLPRAIPEVRTLDVKLHLIPFLPGTQYSWYGYPRVALASDRPDIVAFDRFSKVMLMLKHLANLQGPKLQSKTVTIMQSSRDQPRVDVQFEEIESLLDSVEDAEVDPIWAMMDWPCAVVHF